MTSEHEVAETAEAAGMKAAEADLKATAILLGADDDEAARFSAAAFRAYDGYYERAEDLTLWEVAGKLYGLGRLDGYRVGRAGRPEWAEVPDDEGRSIRDGLLLPPTTPETNIDAVIEPDDDADKPPVFLSDDPGRDDRPLRSFRDGDIPPLPDDEAARMRERAERLISDNPPPDLPPFPPMTEQDGRNDDEQDGTG